MNSAKLVASILLALNVSIAWAQSAPAVKENTGDLNYSYPFSLPGARGRHQPGLALSYSSASRANEGVGAGWSLSGAYIEKATRASPSSATVQDRQQLWLARLGERTLLLPKPGATGCFVPEIVAGDVDVCFDPSSGSYQLKDGSGTTYQFAAQWGERWLLTKVTDLDDNVTEYVHDVASTATAPRLRRIKYNSLSAGQYATLVELIWKADSKAGGTASIAGRLARFDQRLFRVIVIGQDGVTRLRGYQACYYTDDAACSAETPTSVDPPPPGTGRTWVDQLQLHSVTEFAGDVASLAVTTSPLRLPPTRFAYAGEALEPKDRFYRLEGSSAIPAPAVVPNVGEVHGLATARPFPHLIDLDGDGRPDQVWGPASGASGGPGLYWWRNVTVPGSKVPKFEGQPAAVAGFTNYTWYSDEYVPPTTPDYRKDVVSTIIDLDGDGNQELVRTRSPNCPAGQLEVQPLVKSTDSSGLVTLTVGTLTCIANPASNGYAYYKVPLPEFSDVNGDGAMDVVVTGGGPLSGPVGSRWNWGNTYWTAKLGYRSAQGFAFSDGIAMRASPVSPEDRSNPANLWIAGAVDYAGVDQHLGLDMNGDGLPDVAHRRWTHSYSLVPLPEPTGIPQEGQVALTKGQGLSACTNPALLSWDCHDALLNNWDPANPDASFLPADALTTDAFGLGPWGIDFPEPYPVTQSQGNIVCTYPDYCTNRPPYCVVNEQDRARSNHGFADVNGDGLVDELVKEATVLGVNANDGRGFSRRANVTPAFYASSAAMDVHDHGVELMAGSGWQGNCNYSNPHSNTPGWMQDFDGDGIADYVYGGAVYWGSVGFAGPAPEYRLVSVTSPGGATYSITYTPASVFGGSGGGTKAVVTAIRLTGDLLAASTVNYWYAGWQTATAWDETTRRDDRGFAQSWSQDDATFVVHHTIWGATHPTNGTPTLVEAGLPSGPPSAHRVSVANNTSPALDIFQSTSTVYGSKPIAQSLCISAFEPSAADYPIRLVPTSSLSRTLQGSIWAEVTTQISCPDVDSAGRVTKATATPALFGRNGQVVVSRASFASSISMECSAVAQVATSWKEDAAGNLLVKEVVESDSLCRPVKSYALLADGNMTRIEERAYSSGGQLLSVKAAGVLKEFTYDAVNLHVTRTVAKTASPADETVADTETWLESSAGYDAVTGFQLWEQGAVLTRKDGAAVSLTGQAHAPVTRYSVYDGFGRKVLVAKADWNGSALVSPLSTGTATCGGLVPAVVQARNVIEATEYRDTSAVGAPASLVSYRFGLPRTVDGLAGATGVGAALGDTTDVMKSIAYRDALGRVIQVRERLGGTAQAGAQVTQAIDPTHFRVSGVSVLDAAGRKVASLEPFHHRGEAFNGAYATLRPAGLRGTFVIYDERGRPTCSTLRYVGAADSLSTLADDTDCKSFVGSAPEYKPDAAFKLATKVQYGATTSEPGGPFSGAYATIVTTPAETNTVASPPTVTKLSGPSGEEYGVIDAVGNKAFIERDALGREIAAWRVSAAGTYGTSRPASNAWGSGHTTAAPRAATWIVYDLAGQVIETWDASLPTRTTVNTYRDDGLLKITTNKQIGWASGDRIEFTYDMGRVSSVTEFPLGGEKRITSRTHYDAPYPNPVYSAPVFSHVAGQISWTECPASAVGDKAETTIIYGYDDASRLAVRVQQFAKLLLSDEKTPAQFKTATGYGGDGRVLWTQSSSNLGPALEHTVEYDTAGRPVALGGKVTNIDGYRRNEAFWQAVPSDAQGPGAYDALGRIATMKADGNMKLPEMTVETTSGRVTSTRTYDPYTAALTAEAKKVEESTILFSRANVKYVGRRMTAYDDITTGPTNSYSFTYRNDGRLQAATATPPAGATILAQDFNLTYGFDGIGNLASATETWDGIATGRTKVFRSDTYIAGKASDGAVNDQVAAVKAYRTVGVSATPQALLKSTTDYAYDLLGHLTSVTRNGTVPDETLDYGPSGELSSRQVGEEFTFYVGEYATVKARGAAGCGTNCKPLIATATVDSHVLLGGTRIASCSPSRTIYYYRTTLQTVVATSLNGGIPGAQYRYDPYGKLTAAVNETPANASELTYTNALRLTGNLYHLKARVYDAEARVFLQADSVDRQRYAYVNGDPINLNDPSGHAARDPTYNFAGVIGRGIAYGIELAIGAQDAAREARWEAIAVAEAAALRVSTAIAESSKSGVGLAVEVIQGKVLPQDDKNAIELMGYTQKGTESPAWAFRAHEEHDLKSGFDAASFIHRSENQVFVAFGPTLGLADLKTDARAAAGAQVNQFDQAVRFVGDVQHALSEVIEFSGRAPILAGHSLGGGTSAFASAVTGLRAVTANAMGIGDYRLPPGTTRAGLRSRITNYHVVPEVLTTTQQLTDLPKALGRQVWLSPVPGGRNGAVAGIYFHGLKESVWPAVGISDGP